MGMTRGQTTPLTPERRRQQTRQHLLAAAAEVFARRGYHEANLEEIAATAGFSKGAVYSNFTSKEDLFLSLTEAHVTETLERVQAMLASSDIPAGDRLDEFVRLAAENFERERASSTLYMEFWLYASRHPAARERPTLPYGFPSPIQSSEYKAYLPTFLVLIISSHFSLALIFPFTLESNVGVITIYIPRMRA